MYSIREQVSNARVESMNNKIKLIIWRVYGFRNTQNMIDLVMLRCSNIVVPFPNRLQPMNLRGLSGYRYQFSPTLTGEEPYLMILSISRGFLWKI